MGVCVCVCAFNLICNYTGCQAWGHHLLQRLLFALSLASQLSRAVTKSGDIVLHRESGTERFASVFNIIPVNVLPLIRCETIWKLEEIFREESWDRQTSNANVKVGLKEELLIACAQRSSVLPSCVLSGPAPSCSVSSGSPQAPPWSSRTGHNCPWIEIRWHKNAEGMFVDYLFSF